MCGIAGILSVDNTPRKITQPLLSMAQAMAHRGPDDEGFYFVTGGHEGMRYDSEHSFRSRNAFPDIKSRDGLRDIFGMAHRRLSIIAPGEDGRQPLSTDDGRYTICYNGEIYNFADIAAELRGNGINRPFVSDTEVLLYAYALWGEAMLEKLNGMFALAIWDHNNKTLFCARDRIGIKPLYYFKKDGVFVFASDIKTLLASGLITPELDHDNFYHALSMGVAPRPLTSFKNIYALDAGRYLTIKNDTLLIHQWWDIPTNRQIPDMSAEDAEDRLHDELQKSVKRRLVADVEVGTFMSGGIDSCLISALAAGQHPNIKAFTLEFKGAPDGQSELAQAIDNAKKHGIDHHIEYADPRTILDNIDDIIQGYEEPFPQLAPNYLISRFVSNHGVKVALSGLGGDELFAGYYYYDSFPKSYWKSKIFAPLSGLVQDHCPQYALLAQLSRAPHPGLMELVGQQFFSDHAKQRLFNPDFATPDINSLDSFTRLYNLKNKEFTDHVEAMSYMNLKNYLGNHHVYRVDQFTMRFGLESRFPFLDHNVIAAAFQIPTHLKLRNAQQKWILKQVARRYLPESCLTMPKKGFGIPLDNWMRGDLADFMHDHIESLKQWGPFRAGEIDRIVNEWKAGQRPYTQLWMLVSIDLWRKSFKIDA